MIIMRKMKMIKKFLIKMFIPSAKSLADIASEQIYAAVNCSDKEKEAKIANIAKYIDPLATLTTKLVNLLKDGKIDEQEKQKIANDLEPLIQKLIDML